LGPLTAATLDHVEDNTQNFNKPSLGHTHMLIYGLGVGIHEPVFGRRV